MSSNLRPGPVTSDAPDDKPKRAEYIFTFASGGTNTSGTVSVRGWLDANTPKDEDFLYAYEYKSSTEDDPPVILNTNLLLYAKPC